MRLTVERSIEAGHRLKDYDGPCAHPHGHSYRVLLTIAGEPDSLGFVIDFKTLKAIFAVFVEQRMDHAFMVNSQDRPLLDFLADNEYKLLEFIDRNPTAENIAQWIYNVMSVPIEARQLKLVRVELWETATASVTCGSFDPSIRVNS